MTDTTSAAPSDAEIDDQWRESVAKHEKTAAFVRDFARAVLAKWGTPQPVVREPLTDEQIEALPLWKRFVGLWPETRREIVRIIESAHGIGIKGGQHG